MLDQSRQNQLSEIIKEMLSNRADKATVLSVAKDFHRAYDSQSSTPSTVQPNGPAPRFGQNGSIAGGLVGKGIDWLAKDKGQAFRMNPNVKFQPSMESAKSVGPALATLGKEASGYASGKRVVDEFAKGEGSAPETSNQNADLAKNIAAALHRGSIDVKTAAKLLSQLPEAKTVANASKAGMAANAVGAVLPAMSAAGAVSAGIASNAPRLQTNQPPVADAQPDRISIRNVGDNSHELTPEQLSSQPLGAKTDVTQSDYRKVIEHLRSIGNDELADAILNGMK